MEITTLRKYSQGLSAFENIARLQDAICKSNDNNIRISFQNSQRYGKTFIFLLGCLMSLGAQYNKNVLLQLPDNLKKHFKDMSIINYGQSNQSCTQSFFRLTDDQDIIKLIQDIMNDVPVAMSERLSEAMVSLIAEVYNNAKDHSKSEYIIGGCYHKSRTQRNHDRFGISCYDAGVGMISNVQEFLLPGFYEKIKILPEIDTIIQKMMIGWALKRGNSTKGGPRGLGMNTLLDFARVNQGTVTICDKNILFKQDYDGQQIYKVLKVPFRGFFFELEIVDAPNKKYYLKGE